MKSGAKRGHRLREAVLVGHQAVDVALDEQCPSSAAHRLARNAHRVEEVALRIDGRLRRVEVFGLLVAEGAPAEADHASLQIADGKDQPAAKAVVGATAILARHGQPGRDQHVLAEPRLPAGPARRNSQPSGARPRPKRRASFGIDPPALEILARALPARVARAPPHRAARRGPSPGRAPRARSCRSPGRGPRAGPPRPPARARAPPRGR